MLLDIISPTKRCTRNIFGEDVETIEITQPTQDTPAQDVPVSLQESEEWKINFSSKDFYPLGYKKNEKQNVSKWSYLFL